MKGPAKAKHREYRSEPPRHAPADRGDDREHSPKHEEHADGKYDPLRGIHAHTLDQGFKCKIGEDVGMEMFERESWQLSPLDLWSEPGIVDVAGKIPPAGVQEPEAWDQYERRAEQSTRVILPQEAHCANEIGIVECAQACSILIADAAI